MKKSPFEVFRYSDFTIAWVGGFIAQIGFEMQTVAINWQIYLLTKSPLSLGIIGLARFAPVLCFALLAGILADTHDKKKIIIIGQFVLIFSSAMLFYLTVTHQAQPLLIYAIIALYSTALTFNGPARQAMMPHLVPRSHFMQAVAMNAILWQSAMIIGPSIGGFIIGTLGVSTVYIISMIGFTAISISMLLIKPIPPSHEKPEFNLRSIRAGLGFVRRTPLVWSTMFLDFFATFFGSSMTLMPIFAKDILKSGPLSLGLLYAAPALGSVIAGFVFSSLHNVRRQGRILIAAVLIYGLATVAFGLSRSLPLSLCVMFFVGAGDSVSSIIRNTMRQMITPDHIRGRMNSVNMIFYLGGPQLGEVEAGVAASALGTPLSVVVGGIGTMVLTALMMLRVPAIMSYDNHEDIGLYRNKN